MNQAAIQRAFESFLSERSLKLTPQRLRIFERVFETHDHFSAEKLYEWIKMKNRLGLRVQDRVIQHTARQFFEEGETQEASDSLQDGRRTSI